MSRFNNPSRKALLGGHPIYIGLPSVHQHVKELSHGSVTSSHTRFAAWRRWRFLAQKFIRRTALQLYEKLSYEALIRHFCQTAVISWPSVCRGCRVVVCRWFYCNCRAAYVSAVGSGFKNLRRVGNF